MVNEKKRIYRLNNDAVEVDFYFDQELEMYFGDYPDFSENPRFTPDGRPWVNATKIGCPYSHDVYDDCGSCNYFLRETHGDLIGVCTHDANRATE